MEMNQYRQIPVKQFSKSVCLLLLSTFWTTLSYCQDGTAAHHGKGTGTQEDYLYPFRSPASGKVGYIDAQGNIKIAPQFTDCGGINPGREFSGGHVLVGCAPVSYADVSGKQFIARQFDDARPFSQNMAAIKNEDGTWGYISGDGRLAIPPKFTEAGSFSEGLAPVSNDDGEWGYVDVAGREKIPFSFRKAGIFANGLAPVQVDNKFGYIEKSGKVLVPAQFKEARPFSEGLAAVLTDSWSYIGTDGKSAFSGNYQQAGEFSEGLAPVKPKDGKGFGYINRSGAFVIPPQFDSANSFHNGLALVYFKTEHVAGSDKRILHYGYIDKTGRKVFSAELAYVETKEGARGSEGTRSYIPMTAVNIESLPSGAKVYLIPLDDWESEKKLSSQKEKMIRYLLNGYTPLHDYEVIEQVYQVLVELNGKQVSRQFDVNQYSHKNLQIDFQRE